MGSATGASQNGHALISFPKTNTKTDNDLLYVHDKLVNMQSTVLGICLRSIAILLIMQYY